jgi:hypothetical protein
MPQINVCGRGAFHQLLGSTMAVIMAIKNPALNVGLIECEIVLQPDVVFPLRISKKLVFTENVMLIPTDQRQLHTGKTNHVCNSGTLKSGGGNGKSTIRAGK